MRNSDGLTKMFVLTCCCPTLLRIGPSSVPISRLLGSSLPPPFGEKSNGVDSLSSSGGVDFVMVALVVSCCCCVVFVTGDYF